MENTIKQESPDLKLRTKNILWISFGFFAILMMWQIYNFYIPQFLGHLLENNRGQANEEQFTWLIGLLMGVDNLVALLVIPLVGILSDKTKSKMGKRMPYIIAGSVATVVVFPFIPVLFILNSLWGVIALMLVVLVTMNIVRGPAVSLMPDVTPKPLRPKANSIVNLIGYIGAILGGGLTIIVTGRHVNTQSDMLYFPFIVTSIVIVICILLLYLKVKENKLAEEVKDDMEIGEKFAETQASQVSDRQLTKADKFNLWLLLAGIFLWFFAFNAMETFWSTYGNEVFGTHVIENGIPQYYANGEPVMAGGPLIGMSPVVLALVSLASFIPAAMLTKKIGRKLSVITGIIIIVAALIPMLFINSMSLIVVALFGIVGIGWAIINVNSFPMLVEYSSKSTVGKFTGYYYGASQLAQGITPFVAGAVVSWGWGYKALFPYVIIFFIFAFIVMMIFQSKRKNTAGQQITVYDGD